MDEINSFRLKERMQLVKQAKRIIFKYVFLPMQFEINFDNIDNILYIKKRFINIIDEKRILFFLSLEKIFYLEKLIR